MKGGHKRRVEKVREFTSHNKIFTAFAVLLIIFLLFRIVPNRTSENETENQEEQKVSEEAEETGWRFYPIDLVVLGVGGGFCSIMIIRERRKAKEGLN